MESLWCRAGIHQCQIPPFSFLEKGVACEFLVCPVVRTFCFHYWRGLVRWEPASSVAQPKKKEVAHYLTQWWWVRLMVYQGLHHHPGEHRVPAEASYPPPTSLPRSENCVARRALGRICFLSSNLFMLFTGEQSGVQLWFLCSRCRNKSPGPPEHAQSAP